MVVYGDLQSGNCLKVKLILSFLGIEHQWIHVNILENETKTPEFMTINPNGKIPAVVLDDGSTLCESNAILGYFAEGTDFLPSDRYKKAKVYEACCMLVGTANVAAAPLDPIKPHPIDDFMA